MEKVVKLCDEMAPLDAVVEILHTVANWPSIDAQEAFVDEAFGRRQRFLPSLRYRVGLLKRVCREVEERSEDGMADSLAELVLITQASFSRAQCPDDADDDSELRLGVEDGYQSYAVDGEDGGASLCHFRCLRAHNEVGMKVWEAGLFLAELLLSINRSEVMHGEAPDSSQDLLLKGKTVVELGSGVGITSLLVWAGLPDRLRPRRLHITEGPRGVVSNLAYNAYLNAPQSCPSLAPDLLCGSSVDGEEEEGKGEGEGEGGSEPNLQQADDLRVHVLDWSAVSTETCAAMRAEVVLAADCTYSEDISSHLLHCFEKLLTWCDDSLEAPQSGLDGDQRSCAKRIGLVVCTIRNPKTFDHFMGQLSESCVLNFEDITDWAQTAAGPQRFHYSNRQSIRVIKLYPK